jgi:site-specific recombinase XerD
MKEQKLKWELTPDKFLTRDEVKTLRNWVLKRKKTEQTRVASNDWFVIEIVFNSGLRVAEITDLTCSDIVIRSDLSWIFVKNGKGGKSRQVFVPKQFCEETLEYLKEKEVRGEKIGPDDVLLYSPKSKEKYSTRALEIAFDRCMEGAKIKTKHSIHHGRHTYASMLYISSGKNLRFVQNQLGHTDIRITQVYADVFAEDICNAVDNLFT